MKIFKFGGASANSVERIKALKDIVKLYPNDQMVIIISAMGKTTNGLEKVVDAFFEGRKDDALKLFEIIKQQHLKVAKYLLIKYYNNCYLQLKDFFTEIEWLLHDKPVRNYDYYYDQIVCVGELLSTCIISHFLNQEGINNLWVDVRDLLRTDNNFRDAVIDWEYSTEKIEKVVLKNTNKIIITQGFIGSTGDNESSTLGREGSDYTAAVFANILNAESVTIWKDVEGVMNADPKTFPEAELIEALSFTEVIEMSFYGAQVIHPKTIKPLQNKNIPLLVKSFLNPQLTGTIIHQKSKKNLPPIIVIKKDQVLLHLSTHDFSFIGEEPMSFLYQLFAKVKIKPNLIQTGAVSLQLCLDNHASKIESFAQEASSFFEVQIEKELSLLTIRHYSKDSIEKLSAGKTVILQQKTPDTIQMIYRTTE